MTASSDDFIVSLQIPGIMMDVASVALVVSDAKKAAKWYRDVLGWELRDDKKDWLTMSPKGEKLVFHLCEWEKLSGEREQMGNTGISFASKDVPKAERELRQKGVRITKPTTKEVWGTYAMFSDPDGNEFWIIDH